MFSLFSAPFTIFLELDFFCNEFFVLAGPVINALANTAGELYKSIL